MNSPSVEIDRQPIRLAIVSGVSGSGKSTAIRALEDIGFFCIDNLPIVLLPKLIELFPVSRDEIERVALVVDAREARFLDEFEKNIERIRAEGSRVEVVFLDCSEKEIIRRYNETRRRHPLALDGSIEEGIEREQAIVKPLRDMADQVIDTAEMTPHQLRQMIQDHFTHIQPGQEMGVMLVSFGFRYGIPAQAHLVFDARFLANPYFVEELRDGNGLDADVAAHVMSDPGAGKFIDHIMRFVEDFRPLYDKEGKSYLSVCVGCTGGKHRSVTIVEELARHLGDVGGTLTVRHRDMDRL